MEKTKNLSKIKLTLCTIAALTVLAVIISFFNPFEKIDFRIYDFLLGKTKEIKENSEIVFLDVDDDSLAKIGTWPWTRDILGDAVIRLKEFNAQQAIFDIEYVSPASKSVEENIAAMINENFMAGQEAIVNSVLDYAEEIQTGKISTRNAVSAAENLAGIISNDVLYEMQRNIASGVNKDNDDYFARALQFFGNASLTINTRNIGIKRTDEEIQYTKDRFLFSTVSDPKNYFVVDNYYSAREEGIDVRQDFVPAINKIISHANGAGFTNIVIDKDGIRRRVELFNYYDGKFVGQLAFAPLMNLYDAQGFERKKNSLLIKGILLPNNENRINIKIPLDNHGRMLINWLHKDYPNSFTHVPAYRIYYLDLAEKLVFENIINLCNADLSQLSKDDESYLLEGAEFFYNFYSDIQNQKEKLLLKCRGFDNEGNAIRGGLSENDYEEYFNMRSDFFTNLKDFVDSFNEIENAGNATELLNLKENVLGYIHDFNFIKEIFDGAIVLVGNSASSSTDLGSTPFIKRYANLGTHANVINTITNQDFITELSDLWGILICLIVTLCTVFATINLSPNKKIIASLIYVFVSPIMFTIMMVRFNIFIPPLLPVLFVSILPYVFEVIFNIQAINSQKKFLQTKMGAYVSPEVVKEMQKNPGLAELGAQNKFMTALFSDVATFSGFTETLNNSLGEEQGAIKLQQILSDYLGFLTKAIMKENGTVDKFVGDEIVSFFNAPLDDENHAFHACVAGIRMLQAEAEYNMRFKSDLPINLSTGLPFYLHSRVGINTGYMAVGNMGTQDKMNYTVMGNAVNLASRLEGTNKVYGSWIMCSESTWNAANAGENEGKLIARKFDCVRVINVKKPVQIFNILGLRDELPKEQIEAAEIFNRGMDLYLKGSDTPNEQKNIEELKQAYELFKQAESLYPDDASSKFFMERCTDFVENGIPEIWDGVYTMKTK